MTTAGVWFAMAKYGRLGRKKSLFEPSWRELGGAWIGERRCRGLLAGNLGRRSRRSYVDVPGAAKLQ